MKTSNPSTLKASLCIFSKAGVAFFLGLGLFFLDIVSKYYTQALLPLASVSSPAYPFGGIGVFENFYGVQFSINHTINYGAAWGIFRDYPEALFAFRLIMVAGLLVYALFINKIPSRYIPLALIISGASGNILDHFLYGHVVDMFHFNFWGFDYAVFNVADSAICLGVVWLFLLSLSSSSSLSQSNSQNA